MVYVFAAAAVVVILAALSSVKQVPPGAAFVVERLGSFYTVNTEGVHFAVPFIDRVVRKVDMTPQRLPVENIRITSPEGGSVRAAALVSFTVADAQLFHYAVDNTVTALESLTRTALTDLIRSDPGTDGPQGIERKALRAIAPATERWGLAVSEIKLTELS